MQRRRSLGPLTRLQHNTGRELYGAGYGTVFVSPTVVRSTVRATKIAAPMLDNVERVEGAPGSLSELFEEFRPARQSELACPQFDDQSGDTLLVEHIT